MAPQVSRTAVITGASAGIGAAFARRLASEGYNLVLVARRRDRLEALAAELTQAHGVEVHIIAADLASAEGLAEVESGVATVPDLALLVNNAGFGILKRFIDADVEEHDRMHRLHVMATLRLTHAALRRMIPMGRGAVINVASIAGFSASPASVSYAATKAWMNNFTEGLWLDLKTRGSGVRVQALCPGFTLSEFHDVMPMDRSRIPARYWSKPEEVVEASMKGLEKNTLFVIPGWRYKLLVTLGRIVPVSLRHWFIIRGARSTGRLN